MSASTIDPIRHADIGAKPRIDDARRRPHPAEYNDHRAYLRMMVRHLKHTDRNFTYRVFSRRAGFNSSGVLKNVIEGRQNLTAESQLRFGKGLELSPVELKAFQVLVDFTQAQTETDRSEALSRLQSIRGEDHIATLERQHLQVLEVWYVVPILEMFSMHGFTADVSWIAKRLVPRVAESEVVTALELLERVGLIRRGVDGVLERTTGKLATPARVTAPAVRQYHANMLDMAKGALRELDPEQRNVTSLTMGLSAVQYEKATKMIEEFRLNLLQLFEDEGKVAAPEDQIHELVVALFPVTRLPADA